VEVIDMMQASSALALLNPSGTDPVSMAVVGFLARYREPTRTNYTTDLKQYLSWCGANGLHPFEVRRPHLEVFGRWLEERNYALATVAKRLSTVAGFYRFAAIDGYLAHSPAEYLRRPKVDNESTTNGLDRMELGYFIANAQAAGVRDHALSCLLGLLGLRVSEALNLDVEDMGSSRGHRTLRILGKGSKLAFLPMPPPVARAVDRAVGERTAGPILLNRAGTARMDRFAATRIVKRLAKASKIEVRISPHSLRHACITAALDAGATLRDAQVLARHADPRTTQRYDRHRHNMDRSAAYLVSAYIAGGA
jgi:site-specific recombinase XerD